MEHGLSEAGEVSRKTGSQRGTGAISCRAIYTVVRSLDFSLIAMEKRWRIFNKE